MMTERDKIKALVRAFNQFEELQPGDSRYVNCAHERGTDHQSDQMEGLIRNSDEKTCQIFGGHRGGGKTTELLRLKQRLSDGDEPYLVSYCEADNYLDLSRVELADVLLAIIQQLWSDAETLSLSLEAQTVSGKVKGVLREIWHVLQATADLDSLTIKAALVDFKFQVKNSPDNRALVQQHLRHRTPNLIQAVNEIINDMHEEVERLGYQGLVIIVDNLDRMQSLEPGSSGRPLEIELFIDAADTLRSVACHTIYVVPTTLLHSTAVSAIGARFDAPPCVLPMVPVFTRDRKSDEPGIAKLVEIIERRMRYGVENVFDSPETMHRLVLASGGYVRNLIAMARQALSTVERLPATNDDIQNAIFADRDAATRAVSRPDLEAALREVAQTQNIQNIPAHLELLANFLVLEYYERERGYWYDIRPTLRDLYLTQT